MKFFSSIMNWFRKIFSSKQPIVSVVLDSPERSAEPVGNVEANPEIINHSISGNAGIAGANVLLVGPVSKATIADAQGFYSFADLPDGAYVVKPSAPTPGHTFLPEIRVVTVDGADITDVNFIDPSSPVDCRAVTATTPNSSRAVQGSLIYDVQKAESRAAVPVDSRASKPVDSRVSSPQNSRA